MAQRKFEIQLDFIANKQSMDKAMSELAKASNLVQSQGMKFNFSQESINSMKAQIDALSVAIKNSFNSKTGEINFSNVRKELSKTGLSVDELGASFQALGIDARSSLNKIDSGVAQVSTTVKKHKSLMDGFGDTLFNSARWTVASSIVHSIQGSIQKALYFTKDLDRSLTSIRVVSGKSAEDMKKFAVEANNAAKALSTTTNEYAEASLVFFQQGMNQQDVRTMTDTTIMAARIAGETTEEMSNLLTSAVNGYKLAAEEVTTVTDKLSAVGAGTAADFQELSIAMSKVASMANIAGVPIDNLIAQIATIVSITKESPESVGTSLKTIYGRMLAFKNDINADFTDEDGELFSAPAVEAALQKMSVATGKTISLFETVNGKKTLKDLNVTINEIGDNWDSVTDASVRAGVATALAGSRQQNRLLSLLDNWDMYSDAVRMAQESEGSTLTQYAISLDSIEAKTASLTATLEGLYMELFSPDDLKAGLDGINAILKAVTGLVNLIGGLPTIIGSLAGVLTSSKIKETFSADNVYNKKKRKEDGFSIGEGIAITRDPNLSQNEIQKQATEFGRKISGLSKYYSAETIKNLDDQSNAYLRLADQIKKADAAAVAMGQSLDKAKTSLRGDFGSKYNTDPNFIGPQNDFAKKLYESTNVGGKELQEFLVQNKDKKLGASGTKGLTDKVRAYSDQLYANTLSKIKDSGLDAQTEMAAKQRFDAFKKLVFETTGDGRKNLLQISEELDDFKRDMIDTLKTDGADSSLRDEAKRQALVLEEKTIAMEKAAKKSEALTNSYRALSSIAIPALTSAFKTNENYLENFIRSTGSLIPLVGDLGFAAVKAGGGIGTIAKTFALSLGPVALVTAAIGALGFVIWGVSKAIDESIVTMKEQQEIVSNLGSEVQTAEEKLKSFKDELSAKIDADQHYEVTAAEQELYDLYVDQYNLKELQLKQELRLLKIKQAQNAEDGKGDPETSIDAFTESFSAEAYQLGATGKFEDAAQASFSGHKRAAYYDENGDMQTAKYVGQTFEEISASFIDEYSTLLKIRGDLSTEMMLADGNETLEAIVQKDVDKAEAATKEMAAVAKSMMELRMLEFGDDLTFLINPEKDNKYSFWKNLYDDMTNVSNAADDLKTSEEAVADSLLAQQALDAKKIEDLQKIADGYGAAKNSLKILSDALKENNEEGKFSLDTIADLVDEYPHLVSVMNDQAALLKEIEKLQGDTEADAREAIKATLELDEAYYLQLLANKSSYIKRIFEKYGIDLAEFKTIADAKIALDKAMYTNMEADAIEHANKITEIRENSIGVTGKKLKDELFFEDESFNKSNTLNALNPTRVDIDAILQSALDKLNRSSDSSSKDTKNDYEGMSAALQALNDELQKLIRNYDELDEKDISGQIANLKEQSRITTDILKQTTLDMRKEFIDSFKEKAGFSFTELFKLDDKGNVKELGSLDTMTKFYANIDKELSRLSKLENQDQFNALKKTYELIINMSKESIDAQVSLGKIQDTITGKINDQIKASEEFILVLKQEQLEADKKSLAALDELIAKTESLIKFQQEQLKEAIKDKKEKLKLDKDELDYAKKLAESQESVAELETKFMLLSRDNSQAGVARRLEIEEQLAEAKKNLEETESERSLELKEDELDKETELIDDYLSKAGQVTADAMKMIEDDFKSGLGTLKSQLVAWNATYGSSIESDITSAWEGATSALQNYKTILDQSGLAGVKTSLSDSITNAESSGSTSKTPAEIVAMMKANSSSWGAADANQKLILASKNTELSNILKTMPGFEDLERDANGVWILKGKKLYDQYEDGGMSTRTHKAILHGTRNDPEWIFNNAQLKETIANIVLEARRLPNKFSGSSFAASQELGSATGEININFKDMINIEGSADANTVSQLRGATEDIVGAVISKITDSFGLKGQYKIKSI